MLYCARQLNLLPLELDMDAIMLCSTLPEDHTFLPNWVAISVPKRALKKQGGALKYEQGVTHLFL